MKNLSALFCLSLIGMLVAPTVPMALESSNDCVVRNLAVATGVKNNEPVKITSEFKESDKRIYGFVRLDCQIFLGNAELIFYRGGKQYLHLIQKGYSSNNFRAWGYVTARKGIWKFIIRINGTVLASKTFTVSAD